MVNQYISMEQKEHIGYICMKTIHGTNVFTEQLMDELTGALQEFDDNVDVKVVVIESEGKNFSVGRDFNEMRSGKTAIELNIELKKTAERFIRANIEKPVIAKVHGIVAAEGMLLVAACDIIIASSDAVFMMPGIKAGFPCILPATIASRFASPRKCLELLLTAGAMDAQEACIAGLVNKVVPYDELDSAAFDMAKRIAGHSPVAIRLAREAFYTAQSMHYDEAIKYASGMMAVVLTTEDAQEGINSFLEKRPAQWKGC
jgi:enoyl-CoA hydratase/carnithine racemase